MANNKKKLTIIWDMDGTLIDSAPEIIVTIRKALLQNGINPDSLVSPLRIGPPVSQIIRISFPEYILSEEVLENVVKDFRQIYDSSSYESTTVFSGIEDILSNTTNYIHIVITNKPELATRRIIHFKGWDSYISEVLTPTTFAINKKKPELFRIFQETHPNIDPVCIGDMQLDCLCAKGIKAKTVGVLWGTGTKEELSTAECDYIVDTTTQLSNILRNLWQER